jgi:anion-transporting  ArsA/GET3 family ATPase
VGRSTVTAALSLLAQKHGKRVLVTEIGDEGDDYSPLAAHFQRERLPTHPEEVAPGVMGVTLVARTGQEQFLRDVLHAGPLAKAALASETVRRLLNAAPGFKEMGVYYQLLSYLRAKRYDGSPTYDLILVDMPATGHAVMLTSLPEYLLRLVPIGPIAEALREGIAYLNDPKLSAAWIVTLPETLPVSECLELVQGLNQTRMPVGGVFLNRVAVDPFKPEERKAMEALLAARPSLFGSEGFARFDLNAREAKRLREAMPHPIHAIPEMPLSDRELIPRVAEALGSKAVNEALFGSASSQKVAS